MPEIDVEEYNKALDAYLSYGENLSKNYSDVTMTLTLDGNNKPIFLAFLGEMENSMLEISSYIDGNVKTLGTIKANHVWKLDSGIIVAQYGSDDEDKEKYQIVQVKDDELRLLMKGTGLWGYGSDDKDITLYFGNEDKKTTIQAVYESSYGEEDFYDFPVAKDYEKEIKEWFTYVYGNDKRYLDWMSNLTVDTIFFEGDIIFDDIPLICSSYTLFEAKGVGGMDTYENIVTLRAMIQNMKNEPKSNWKDFFIFDADRQYELFDYIFGYANPVFPHIDIDWISELDYIKELNVSTLKYGEIEDFINCNYGVLYIDNLYSIMCSMNCVFCNDSESEAAEYVAYPIRTFFENIENSEISGYTLEKYYTDVNRKLMEQWLVDYLKIDSIEETVDMKIDNSALIKEYYEWILSKEYEEKLNTELDKIIPKKEGDNREEIEKDIYNCDKISYAINYMLADEPTWNIMENKEILFEIKTGVTPLANAVVINGISEKNDELKLIDEMAENLNGLDNQIYFKQDMDGSGIMQESFYVLVDKTGKTAAYISGAGKTIEEIKNDKEGDGIYRILPDLCSEYK